MRLNGASFNAVPHNGAVRLLVAGDGEAASALASALDGTRIQHGDAGAAMVLAGGFLGSCQRYFGQDLPAEFSISVSPSVARSGSGSAPLVLDGSLYYTRTQLIFGSALLEFDAKGYVGVVFIDGEAVTTPGEAQLTGTRVRQANGQDAPAVFQSSLSASAYRRGWTGIPDELSLTAEMEPSHIHAGVKYIGGVGRAAMALTAEDAGMIRQNLIGSADYEFAAYGSGRAIRRPSFQVAPLQLAMSADFVVYRRAINVPGVMLPLVCVAQLAADILVRGSGEAVARLAPECTGYVYRRTASGEAVSAMDVTLDGIRVRKLSADSPAMALEGELAATRTHFGDASFVVPLVGAADGVINPDRDDNDTEQFYRPAMERVFTRPGHVREWRRA